MQEAKVTQEEAESAKEDADKEPFEENEEETSTNPEAEETSETSEEEETSTEESQESSEEPDKAKQELEAKNKQLFGRAKKAESKLKKFEKAVDKGDEVASSDPIELAKTISALKDFSADELDYVQLIAKGKNLALDEAVETDEVKTYIEAKRKKAEGERKTPSPSSPSAVLGGKTPEDLEKMDNRTFAKHVSEDMKGRRIGI